MRQRSTLPDGRDLACVLLVEGRVVLTLSHEYEGWQG